MSARIYPVEERPVDNMAEKREISGVRFIRNESEWTAVSLEDDTRATASSLTEVDYG